MEDAISQAQYRLAELDQSIALENSCLSALDSLIGEQRQEITALDARIAAQIIDLRQLNAKITRMYTAKGMLVPSWLQREVEDLKALAARINLPWADNLEVEPVAA